MKTMKLLREPGYVYDLMFIFFLNFNKKYCVENFARNENDVVTYENISREFGPVSDDLFLFFRILKNERCFMTSNFFDNYKHEFTSSYNTERVLESLSDHKTFVRAFVKSYFPELSENEIEEYLCDGLKLTRYIKRSDYSDSVKSRLYEFFAEPADYIQKLQYELMKKDVLLTSYYEKKYTQMISVYNELSIEKLHKQLEGMKEDIGFFKDDKETLFVSFCLLNTGHLSYRGIKEGVLYLLGDTYLKSIEYIKDNEKNLKLNEFCSALSEENRVRILNFVFRRGEISCKDLEKEFSFSGSTAYHHLSVMMRNGVFKTRNVGKTIYYSINGKYFNTMIKLFAKYIEQDEEDNN